MRHRIFKPITWATPLLAVALAACENPYGYDDYIEGFYDYAGTVYDAPGYSVNGQMYVNQSTSRREADAELEWYMYEGSRAIVQIESGYVPMTMYSDGRVRWVVTGEMQLSDGDWVDFRLEHDGRVRGGTIRGTWELTTDLPSTDRSTFTASR